MWCVSDSLQQETAKHGSMSRGCLTYQNIPDCWICASMEHSCLLGSTCGTVIKIWNGNKTQDKNRVVVRWGGVGGGGFSLKSPHPPIHPLYNFLTCLDQQLRYNISCTEHKWISNTICYL